MSCWPILFLLLAQEMRSYDRTVGVSCDDDAVHAMGIQYTCNRSTHCAACERRIGDVHADGHYFYSENTDVRVLRSELAEERYVGQEADADAMDEEDRGFRVRAVRTIPVGYIGFYVRGSAREQREEWTWRKDMEPFTSIIVYESLIIENNGRIGIDETDQLFAAFSEREESLYAEKNVPCTRGRDGVPYEQGPG
jgi:hypothetical protein